MSTWTPTPGVYSLEDFRLFCPELRLENGSPLYLEDYEAEALADYFLGATETVIIIPKKNGKTTILGALALYHLRAWTKAMCLIGAHSRDQARILFGQAASLLDGSPIRGEFDIKSGYGSIRLAGGTKTGPQVKVIAADANTGDGVIPTLALVDELHRHPSADLYGVFRDGLTARGGQMVTISTAGASIDSPLGLLRTKAHELPGFVRDEARRRNYARSEDGSFAFHEWCLEPEDDVDDMSLVKLVNPAPWQTVTELQRRHDSPSMTPGQWLRFACDIWTEGDEPWIEPKDWDVLKEPGLEIPEGPEVVLAVDLGVRHDTTGLVLVCLQPDGRMITKAQIMAPGKVQAIALADVEERIRAVARKYHVIGVAYDPWSFRRSAEILESEGLPMIEFPQHPDRMGDASATLYSLIKEGRIRHDGDPAFRSQVLAGVTKETERGWRLQKDPKMKRPIDALIALAMAAHTATELNKPPQILVGLG